MFLASRTVAYRYCVVVGFIVNSAMFSQAEFELSFLSLNKVLRLFRNNTAVPSFQRATIIESREDISVRLCKNLRFCILHGDKPITNQISNLETRPVRL